MNDFSGLEKIGVKEFIRKEFLRSGATTIANGSIDIKNNTVKVLLVLLKFGW